MSRVSLIRHGFSGVNSTTGVTKIEFVEGSHPEFLNIPVELSRIFGENIMIPGLKERVENLISSEEITEIVTDFSSQRTFETAKFMSHTSRLNSVMGIPTEIDSELDPAVSVIEFKTSKEDRIKTADSLRGIAHEIASSFLKNLGLKLKRSKESSEEDPSAWELLELPELTLLADVVVMTGGYPGSCVEILKEAGWETPRDLENLVNQAQLLIAIEKQINISNTPYGPAKFILDRMSEDTTRYIGVTYDSVILPLLTSLELIQDVFVLMPLHEIRFEYSDPKHIKVVSNRFMVDSNTGSISISEMEQSVLGIVKVSHLRRLAEKSKSHEDRVRVSFT